MINHSIVIDFLLNISFGALNDLNNEPNQSHENQIIDKSNSISISKFSNSSKKIRIIIILILILIFLTFIILYVQKSQNIYNPTILNYLTKRFQPSQDFTIIIHSSNSTKWRLNKYLSTYIINKPHIHIYIVYAEGVTPDPRYNYIIAKGCKDDRSDLHCKNAFAYNYFLKNENLGDFLYRAIDDTYLNITNLEKLLNELRSIYDPRIHLVFRAFANDESPVGKIYLGGGSGWLMSRAMVSIHSIPSFSFDENINFAFAGQDDTCETLIVKKVGFKCLIVWEDLRWAEGGCTLGDFDEYLKGNFSEMKKCPDNKDLTPISDMIAMHSVDEKQKENWMKVRYFPSFVYGYKVTNNQCVRMCKSVPGKGTNRTSFLYLKENAEFITVADLKEKNLSTFNNYANFVTRYCGK